MTQCPFTLKPNAFKIVQEEDGKFIGKSDDGSSIAGEDMAGLEREYVATMAMYKAMQSAVKERGSFMLIEPGDVVIVGDFADGNRANLHERACRKVQIYASHEAQGKAVPFIDAESAGMSAS